MCGRTNELIKEQTELEKQRMLIAQSNKNKTRYHSRINVLSIILTQPRVKILVALKMASQSSRSTSNGEVTEEEDKHDIQIEITITEDMWVQGACGNSKLV